MKKTISLILMFSVLLFTGVQSVFAGAGPVEMLQSVADQMIASLEKNKTSLKKNPTLTYSLAYKIVVPHADLAEMAKRVLPPQTWRQATASQRAQFEKEFTKLLVRTYASALSDYDNQKVNFNPVRGGYAGRSNVNVSSQIIRSDGPSVSVNYSVVLKGNEWKLYDMSVEGISLLESFRSQFAAKLSQGNFEALLGDLRQHNNN